MTDDALDVDQSIETALGLQRAGQFADAETIYRNILKLAPNNAEALHFLGLTRHQQGEHAEAIEHIQKAIKLQPEILQFQFNLGLVQTAGAFFADATNTFETLYARTPDQPEIANAYAVALKGAYRLAKAESILQRLVSDHPEYAAGHVNLGNLYLSQGKASEAVQSFDSALRFINDPSVYRNLAAALQAEGNSERAIKILEAVLHSSPNDAAALNNLSNLYREKGDLYKAEELLKQALSIEPQLADGWYNLGAIKATRNDLAEASKAFEKAIHYRPGFTKATWAAALALPQIYQSEAHRQDTRTNWENGLEQIINAPLPKTSEDIQSALAAISEITPFALAYQGENDCALMASCGDRVSDIAKIAFPQFSSPKAPVQRTRKRIAFVSAHFRSHTIERLFSGWLRGLDKDAFDIQLISTSGAGDSRTSELCANASGSFTRSTSIPEIALHLHDLAADVIVYPDIGMDPRTQVLAALPLAAKQAMAWGHPVTSGLPTIDVFLSSALMEPAGSQDQYREKLFMLPNLSISYERPAYPKEAFPHDFLCAQSLFKIAPQQDRVFAEILKQTPGTTLSFFAHPIYDVTATFEQRLGSILKETGLDPSVRLKFIQPCDRATFMGHLSGAKVILDTFEWSGGNTSLESFAMGTPVITWPGTFMRGRHTFAMLKLMGISPLIANDMDDYIQIAVSLFEDQAMHAEIANQIAEHSDRLFGDVEPIQALAKFLDGF